jgi:hypothetical protein
MAANDREAKWTEYRRAGYPETANGIHFATVGVASGHREVIEHRH